jgi:hypothetical protein
MKNTNTYKVDFAKGTITLTRGFAEKANILNSAEYKTLRKLKNDFPTLEIFQRTATVSATKKTHKGLTLDRMEKYITTFEPAEALKVYYKVKAYNTDLKETKDGDIVEITNYGKVKKWFLNKYPEYEKTETAFDDMIELLDELEAAAENTSLNAVSTEDTSKNEAKSA